MFAFELSDGTQHAIEVTLRILLIVAVAALLRIIVGRAIGRTTSQMKTRLTSGPIATLGGALGTPSTDTTSRVEARANTIQAMSTSLATWIIFTVAFLMVLSELDIDLAPLLDGAGSAGGAIGFGAQNLVRDFVTGVFMLLEDQYGVGDTVDLGEAVGEVESVGLRITTVRDIDGTLWYVRNGEIARVGNMSQEYAVARIEVPVALTADVDRAEQVAVQAAEEAVADPALAAKVLGEPQMLGVQEFSPDLIKLRMTVKVRPNAQWAVQRKLRRAILRAYDTHGIDLPYPGGRIQAVGE